jgi:predicted HicB family RNase H-like nuclease
MPAKLHREVTYAAKKKKESVNNLIIEVLAAFTSKA